MYSHEFMRGRPPVRCKVACEHDFADTAHPSFIEKVTLNELMNYAIYLARFY